METPGSRVAEAGGFERPPGIVYPGGYHVGWQHRSERGFPMCSRVTCSVCGKVTWEGCGQHVEEALQGISEEQLCAGHDGVAA